MTAMKFVGVAFDPEKYKAGEAEINEALSEGFEVMRDFETGGGIVMCMAKWDRKSKGGEKMKQEKSICVKCEKDRSKHSKMLWALHNQTELCGFCQKNRQ